jgi:hypothetical protein
MAVDIEEIRLTAGETLRIVDDGEGWKAVAYHQVGIGGSGLMVGLGRTREEALESARTTLQNALNVVDLAIVRRA